MSNVSRASLQCQLVHMRACDCVELFPAIQILREEGMELESEESEVERIEGRRK